MALARIGASVGQFSRLRLNTLAHYKSELLPPSPAEIPEAIASAAKVINSAVTMKFMNLTTKEALANAVVGVEVLCWFFIGECIGKRALVGYKV